MTQESEKYVEELIKRISPELELDCNEKDGCSICRDGKAALRAAIKEAMAHALKDAAEWGGSYTGEVDSLESHAQYNGFWDGRAQYKYQLLEKAAEFERKG